MTIIGSARIDENGHAYGGKAGDQKQTGKPDYRGEVSMQEFYVSNKGWIVARLVDPKQANTCAKTMQTACNNDHIGYNQWKRYGLVNEDVDTTKNVETDCSALVRRCILDATGVDVGDIRTILMERVLNEYVKKGLFMKLMQYKPGMALYTGDILFTGTLGHPVSGHTVVVVQGLARTNDGSENVVRIAEPTLRKGSTGSEVKVLQRNLNLIRVYDNRGNKLEVDGDYGKLTTQAVKNFQKEENIEKDGIYGKITYAHLASAINK